MLVHDLPREMESQTDSADVRVRAVEGLKDPLALVLRYPAAVVMDGDPQRVVAGPDLDLHRSIRRTVFRGVVDEVHQHLLDPDRVDVRADALRARCLRSDARPGSLGRLARER